MVQSDSKRALALGGTIFAACMMIMVGLWQVVIGIALIAEDPVFSSAANYTFEFNLPLWGWTHLIVGALAAVVGFALFTGQAWARYIGIGLATLLAIANFIWLPYQPFWSILVIAGYVFAIWALANVSQAVSARGGRAGAVGTGEADWRGMDTQSRTAAQTNPSREGMDDRQRAEEAHRRERGSTSM